MQSNPHWATFHIHVGKYLQVSARENFSAERARFWSHGFHVVSPYVSSQACLLPAMKGAAKNFSVQSSAAFRFLDTNKCACRPCGLAHTMPNSQQLSGNGNSPAQANSKRGWRSVDDNNDDTNMTQLSATGPKNPRPHRKEEMRANATRSL